MVKPKDIAPDGFLTAEEFSRVAKFIWSDEKGAWQIHAAKDLGVSTQTISNWACGRNRVPSNLILRLEREQQKRLTS